MDQKAKLVQQIIEIRAEIEATALEMMQKSNAPGDAGLYYSYYSSEAEELRQKQKISLQKLNILSGCLREIERKEEEANNK